MIISAFQVTTEPRGFAVCEWFATSRAQAERIAEALSKKLAEDARYPNAFWVTDGTKNFAKWFRGERFAPDVSI